MINVYRDQIYLYILTRVSGCTLSLDVSFFSRFIKSRNRQHLTYKLKPNHMADLTAKEIEKRKGLLHDAIGSNENGGKPFVLSVKDRGVALPEHVDWRKAGRIWFMCYTVLFHHHKNAS